LRAGFRAALVFGADLIGDRQAIAIARTRATELAWPTGIARHAAAAALIRLALTDLVAGNALTVLGIPLELADVLAGRARQRGASVTSRAARVVRTIGGAVRVEVVRPGADTEKMICAIALRAGATARVKLPRALRVNELAEVP